LSAITNLQEIVKNLKPTLFTAEYVFCTMVDFDFSQLKKLKSIGMFKEEEGFSIIVEKSIAVENNLKFNGIFALQNGDFKGAQFNGVFNIQNGDFIGVQFSEVFNIAHGDFTGFQVGSSFNLLSGTFRGVQIGAVNITRYFDSGVQIGLVNISQDHNGIPLGLFTYVNGIPVGFEIWYNDSQFINAAIRSGNENWYNLVSVGRRIEGDTRYHTFGAGFGRKIYIGQGWSLDIGISAYKLLDDNFKDNKWEDGNLGALAKLNIIFRRDLGHEGSLIFGPTLNVWSSKVAVEDLTQNLWVDEFENNRYLRIWPGFIIGLEL